MWKFYWLRTLEPGVKLHESHLMLFFFLSFVVFDFLLTTMFSSLEEKKEKERTKENGEDVRSSPELDQCRPTYHIRG
jgi:hypothetical protein